MAGLVGLLGAFAAPSAAQAQNIDRLVNLNDTGSDPTAAGGIILYNVRVENDGLDAAPPTILTFTIPATTTFTGATGMLTNCGPVPTLGPGVVTCDVPALASDATASGVLGLRTSRQGTVSVTASLPAAGDADPANNSETQSTTVTQGADLALDISGPATVAAGGIVTITLTATNNGPDEADGATVALPVPTGLANVVVPAGCALAGGVITCRVPDNFANGASVSFVITGQAAVASGSTITAAGAVEEGTPTDPIADNDIDTLDIDVTAGTDLSIAKARSPSGTLIVGDAVTFTLTSAYTGDVPSGITVTDTLPAGYAIGSVGGQGWTCSVSGQTVTCTRASGTVAGASVALPPITIAATAVTSGSFTNIAIIAASAPNDPNPSNDVAGDGGAIVQQPFLDLVTTKTGPRPALVVVGNTYAFVLTSTNQGNVPFVGTLVLTDSLPAGLTATGVSGSGWSCTPAASPGSPVVGPATITCTRVYAAGAPLAAGASAPAVTLQAIATTTGPIRNEASTTSPDSDPQDPVASSGGYTVTGSVATASTDLVLTKTAGLATVPAGEVQTFVIEIENRGPQVATNIDLEDLLESLQNSAEGPTGAGLVSVGITAGSATGATCASSPRGGAARLLECSFASLPICTPGSDCPVVTVQVRPGGDAGSRVNQAIVFSQDVADPDTANNAAAAAFAVEARADVTVTKSATPASAVAGQNVVYVVTARNVANGLSAADAVTIADTLPAGVVFLSATPSAGTCTAAPAANSLVGPGNDQVACDLGPIANGAQRTVTITVRPTNALTGTTITNAVSVATATIETDATNNAATVATPVTPAILDLLVNKTDSVDPVALGDQTVYTVTVRNLGPSAAENVVLTDALPPSRLSFQSFAAPVDATCTAPAPGSFGGTLTCAFPGLLAGQARVVTVTMEGEVKGVTTNGARVSSDEVLAGGDTNAGNNATTENTTVRTRADVAVTGKAAIPATVDLRQDFAWVITVANATGPGLTEADDVVVSDTLPAGIVLTGTPTVLVTAGTASLTTCTGVAGGTSFSCNLGTVSSGGAVTITAPVETVTVTANPQAFANTARIATSSLDVNAANNQATGTVTVDSSSLAGMLFRDFDDSGTLTAGADTGIAGIAVTLTGTSFDGVAVTRTTATGPGGAYAFTLLPEGTYTVRHGPIAEPYLAPGTNTPGSEGGTASGTDSIVAIPLPGGTDAIGYDFAKIPQARVAIAKAVQAGPTTNADGSFDVTFRLRVTNPSLEALEDVAVTDALAGGAPLFGGFVASAAALTPGTYTLTAGPSGSCGGLNAGFDGDGDRTVLAGATLAAGATCSVDLALRVQPTAPLPEISGGGRYLNQAAVTAKGALSGQTAPGNPQLADRSDNGTTADPDGDGQGNEAGENDPTPVSPAVSPSITVDKTADITGFSDPVTVGDTIAYAFVVTNTGNVALADLSIVDALPGVTVSGGPLAILAPGASDATTFTATYALTAADLAAGEVINDATASGTWTTVGGVPQRVSDNDQVTTTLGMIELVKTADASGLSVPPLAGERITYRFAVTNTGNTTLRNVTIADALPGVTVTPASLALLAAGATDATTFTATYPITQDDIDVGRVDNVATVTGRYGPGNTIGVSDDSAASTSLFPEAAVRLVKSVAGVTDVNANGVTDAGDLVAYAFAVTNTGDVALRVTTLADPLVAVSGGPVTIAPGATDGATFTATYTLTRADVDRGYVDNQASVDGEGVNGAGDPILGAGGVPLTATDLSDTGTDADRAAVADPGATGTPSGDGTVGADPTADPTPLRIPPQAALRLVKSVSAVADTTSDGTIGPGDTVSYAFAVTNTGNLDLADVTVTDPLVTVAGGPVDIATGATDATAFTATYVLTQADRDLGFVQNTAGAAGAAVTTGGVPVTDAGGAPVTATDVSDTGTAPDGATVADPAATETPDGTGAVNGDPGDDPTVTRLVQAPAIAVVKTADATGLRSPAQVGDVVRYAFAVTNTGDVTLRDIVIADALPGIVLSGGPITLAPGATDTTTFTATYALNRADVTAGTVRNQATATGLYGPLGGTLAVDDLSGTGPGDDEATVITFQGGIPGGLTIAKTADRGTAYVGEVVGYTVVATNPAQGVPAVVDVVDRLPDGFAFVGDSARVAGVPVPALEDDGTVTVEDVAVGPGESVAVTIDVLVTGAADPGDHVNVARLLDPATGAALSEEARATVRVLVEPVFDCGTVIGRVFDDLNGDGYMNENGEDRARITDQAYVPDGKFGAGPLAPEGEAGLPAVRLVAPDGLSVISDARGRFSVPCAMLPPSGGSNFSLRLDERSLPAGFRVTTENPRVVILTPGMITEMNFGATLSRVVRVDLADAAFVGAEPRPELVEGLRTMVAQMASMPATLRVTYAAAGEDGALVRARLAAVERVARGLWPANGRYALGIEAVVQHRTGTE